MIKKLLLLTPIMLVVGCGEPAKTMERTSAPASSPVKAAEEGGATDAPEQANAL